MAALTAAMCTCVLWLVKQKAVVLPNMSLTTDDVISWQDTRVALRPGCGHGTPEDSLRHPVEKLCSRFQVVSLIIIFSGCSSCVSDTHIIDSTHYPISNNFLKYYSLLLLVHPVSAFCLCPDLFFHLVKYCALGFFVSLGSEVVGVRYVRSWQKLENLLCLGVNMTRRGSCVQTQPWAKNVRRSQDPS